MRPSRLILTFVLTIGLLASPVAQAQEPMKVARVGVLSLSSVVVSWSSTCGPRGSWASRSPLARGDDVIE